MRAPLFSLLQWMLFLSSCVTVPLSTPPPLTDVTQKPASATPAAYEETVAALSAPTNTPTAVPATTPVPSTPTFVSTTLPKELTVAYVTEDKLWIWKQNNLQLLTQRQNISAPLLSDDGQWVLFKQRHIQPGGSAPPSDELWVIRTDGSDLHRLIGSEDLMALTGDEAALLINDLGWRPGRQEVLFNTDEVVEGPPGSWPSYNLYSLDLAGHVTRLAEPGQGGRFYSSPNGSYVALVTNSKIGILDLDNGERRTLLEFEPVGLRCECLYIPSVVWDPQENSVITSILPQYLYYPEKYTGEPEQVWRLFVDGRAELIAQLQPVTQNHAGITVSPNQQYFFYLKASCPDAMGMLYVRDMASGEEFPITCVWNRPRWLPDNEHFIYKLGPWQLGSIHSTISERVDVLNVPTDPNVSGSAQLTWINQEHFLLVLRSSDTCTLSVATLEGKVMEIVSTPPDACPWMVDFSLPN